MYTVKAGAARYRVKAGVAKMPVKRAGSVACNADCANHACMRCLRGRNRNSCWSLVGRVAAHAPTLQCTTTTLAGSAASHAAASAQNCCTRAKGGV
jgi:hypothetical protein